MAEEWMTSVIKKSELKPLYCPLVVGGSYETILLYYLSSSTSVKLIFFREHI